MLTISRVDDLDEYGRLRTEPVVRLRHLGLLNPATPVVAVITPPGAPNGSSHQLVFGPANKQLPAIAQFAIPALVRLAEASMTSRDQFGHPWALVDRQLSSAAALLCSVCEEATRQVGRLAAGQELPDFLTVDEMDTQIAATAQRLQEEVDTLLEAGTK